jgi:hypothetical protein
VEKDVNCGHLSPREWNRTGEQVGRVRPSDSARIRIRRRDPSREEENKREQNQEKGKGVIPWCTHLGLENKLEARLELGAAREPRAEPSRAEPAFWARSRSEPSRAGSFRLASYVKLLNMYNTDGYWLVL